MYSVKGYINHNNNYKPEYEKEYQTIKDIADYIKAKSERLILPELNEDGSLVKDIEKNKLCFVIGRNHDGDPIYEHICLIQKGNVMCYSDGHYTSGFAFMSKAMQELLKELLS